MPRFFFDLTEGDKAFNDTEGTELPDVEHARSEALATLCQLAKDHPPDGEGMVLKAAVRSQAGQTLLVASLSITVQLQLS